MVTQGSRLVGDACLGRAPGAGHRELEAGPVKPADAVEAKLEDALE